MISFQLKVNIFPCCVQILSNSYLKDHWRRAGHWRKRKPISGSIQHIQHIPNLTGITKPHQWNNENDQNRLQMTALFFKFFFEKKASLNCESTLYQSKHGKSNILLYESFHLSKITVSCCELCHQGIINNFFTTWCFG